jgi:hypothetical protein
MELIQIMKMKQADLEFLVQNHNGALGATGTGSGTSAPPPQGTNCCDGSTVHCVFAPYDVLNIQVANPGESESGYKLVVINGCEFGIGIE